jgi:signal transduction histidine kinase
VAIGAPAAGFVQRNRGKLFTSTPMVLTTLEQRRVQYMSLTPNDAVVPIEIDYKAVIENILEVLPETRDVAVVNGTSPNEQFWSDQIRQESTSFADRVKFRFWDNLSFDNILREAARLPPHSAILWEGMSVDADGVVRDGDEAFRRLHAASKAPIFSYTEPLIGQGVVGGPFNAVRDTSHTAAAVVVRILEGEKPGDIKMSPLKFSTPSFDWRELRRWGISESRLPTGSEIYFREPTVWEAYRWQIMLTITLILAQSALITGLLYEHRRRAIAEVRAGQRSAELAHINRYAMAGELTASIAHEINQPLGAILTNAETAQLILNSPTPDLKEVREILSDIHRDDQRASQVIIRLRSLLKKAPFELEELDLNDLASDTVDLLSRVAAARNVKVDSLLASVSLPIKGDRVQLQQVAVNLAINAMDAMSTLPSAQRILSINTVKRDAFAQISVRAGHTAR